MDCANLAAQHATPVLQPLAIPPPVPHVNKVQIKYKQDLSPDVEDKGETLQSPAEMN